MTTLDDFFRTPSDIPPHPRLRNWKARLSQPGVKGELEVYRPSPALGLAQTELVLHFTKDGQPQPIETVAWDDDLSTGLIKLGVRCIDTDQEVERFALGLRGALRKAEREFGDGYLNAVLVDFIARSDLTRYPEVAEVLKYSTALQLDRDGRSSRSYSLCREMIDDAIGARAHELREDLGFAQEDAKRILVLALARYLDERFSVSSRQRLGLL